MDCKECGRDRPIVNKYFNLCLECNNLRLHGNKYGKQYDISLSRRKSLTSHKNKRKRENTRSLSAPDFSKEEKKLSMIEQDELFYEKCFHYSDHRCEECGEPLPEIFRDGSGKVVARWRYSHIIPKSIAPELRHDIKNINHLCAKHHIQWDFGDKKSMSIYDNNRKKFPQFL